MDTNEAAEAAINLTYPGLTLLFRDANLGNLVSEYRINMIIREKGFIDASKRGGGICTDCRFAILSKSFMDASEYEHGTNWDYV